MRISPLAAALCLAVSGLALAETATEQLAVAPATAQHFTIMSKAGKHGTSDRWTSPDGARMGRESLVLRGQVFEVDSSAHVGSDGMLDHVVIRGHTPNGDAAESFDIKDGVASWKSPVDASSSPYRGTAEYNSFGGTNDLGADFFEALLAASDKSLAMLPGGRAHAEVLATLTVGDGDAKKKVIAYVVTGISNTPVTVWADESGK